ncbi:MAG: ATP-binding protein [Candidatus Babeliales bacterium]|jgi:two-component system nitrogen regulation sensor histidine kinase NtrY
MNTVKFKRILILISSVLALFAITWVELFLQRKQNIIGAGINRAFLFLLINFHVIIIAFLLYVIIRQSIKLFLEWHRSTPGSVFKRNLLFALTLFSVIPSFFVFFTAGKFISTSIDDWFHTRISQGLQNGLKLHEIQTEDLRLRMVTHGEELLKNIDSQIKEESPDNPIFSEAFKREFENLKLKYPEAKNYSFYVWQENRSGILGKIKDEVLVWREYRKLNDRTTHHLKKEFFQAMNIYEGKKPFDFYGSLYWVKKINTVYFVLAQRYPASIRYPLIEIQNSISDYQQLKSMRNPIYFSYICTFIFITLLILFLSIWCAFYFARGLVQPIQELLGAMIQIRNGNWDVKVNYHPDNDLNHLTHGFNDMTNALKMAQIQLNEKNREMMLILENIRASVFLVNKFGRIVTSNIPGQKMIHDLFGSSECENKKINVFCPEIKNKIIELTRELVKTQKQNIIKEISFSHHGEDKTFMIHLAKINIEHSLEVTEKGLLIFIEDLTDIVKINTLKTWQEAAKQMAHEVKNPLTPIQISTQRLQRKYSDALNNDPIFIDCTNIILEQVKTIKDLVSHFSKFASMPQLFLETANINELITQTIRLYQVSYPDINIVLNLDHAITEMKLDKKKIRRVFTNLLDNSIRAIQQEQPSSDYKPFIKIQTRFIKHQNKIEILFIDNGPGIPKIIQNKLFMPYVSTDKKNMGLGLAIVRDIIEQMGGKIELEKSDSQINEPQKLGARFKIELPFNIFKI